MTSTGDYALVEAIVVSYSGDQAVGDYRGLRARVVSTTWPALTHHRNEDGTVLFSLNRIQLGEQVRAERAEKQAANPGTRNGVISNFAAPKPPTEMTGH